MPIERLLHKGETLDDLRRAFHENVVVHASGCWFWRDDADAYGTFRDLPAHRVSWELHQGPIQSGLVIMHGCDLAEPSRRPMPGCVNPAHLRPGTPGENAEDVHRKPGKAGAEWDPWNDKPTIALHLRLNQAEMDALGVLAKATCTSKQQLARSTIREMLRRNRAKAAKMALPHPRSNRPC